MPKRPPVRDLVPIESIERRIFVLRGHRVMLDRDLAVLFGVPLKRLTEQVKRNVSRFPDDFMFQLTIEEGKAVLGSRSQIATLKQGTNLKYAPRVFTEHGAVMLANVLRSAVAVNASIQVVRAFVRLRQAIASNKQLARQIEALERKFGKHDEDIQSILAALHHILGPQQATPRRRYGFVSLDKR